MGNKIRGKSGQVTIFIIIAILIVIAILVIYFFAIKPKIQTPSQLSIQQEIQEWRHIQMHCLLQSP